MAEESHDRRWFAAIWDRMVKAEGPAARDARRRVMEGAEGRTLELGLGVGANWHYLPDGIDYVGIEPNPSMLARARKHARETGFRGELEEAVAEQLPFDDESFDTVVVTLTLCSVGDPERALAEARRVLKPGGELRFWEHVRPRGTVGGGLTDLLTPIWRRLCGGCHPNRRTVSAIRAAGFELVDSRRSRIGPIPAVVGVARKP